jgi:hypothetical protein
MERRDRSPSPRRKKNIVENFPEEMEVDEPPRLKRKRSPKQKKKKEKMEVEYLAEAMVEEDPALLEKEVKKFEKIQERQKKWKYFETPGVRKITPPLEEISVLENRMYYKPEATSYLVRALLYYALERDRKDVCVVKNFTFEQVFKGVILFKDIFEYFYSKGNLIDINKNWNLLSLNLKGKLKDEFDKQKSIFDDYISEYTLDSDQYYERLKKNQEAPIIFGLMEYILAMGGPRYKNKKFSISTQAFENCLTNPNIRFVIIPLAYDKHMNVIIVDKKHKTAERFEPYGQIVYTKDLGLGEDQKAIDKVLEDFFQKYQYKYYDPQHFCPVQGIQYQMEHGKGKPAQKYGTTGFCVTWSYLFTIMRLTHPEISNDKIASSLIKKIQKMAKSTYIKMNFQKILSKKDYLKKEFILEFIYEYVSSLFKNISNEISEINKFFPKLNLKLEDRILIF